MGPSVTAVVPMARAVPRAAPAAVTPAATVAPVRVAARAVAVAVTPAATAIQSSFPPSILGHALFARDFRIFGRAREDKVGKGAVSLVGSSSTPSVMRPPWRGGGAYSSIKYQVSSGKW